MDKRTVDFIRNARKESNLVQAQYYYEMAIESGYSNDTSVNILDEYAYNFLAIRKRDFDSAIKIYEEIFNLIKLTFSKSQSADQKIRPKTIANVLTDYSDFLVANGYNAVAIEKLNESLLLGYQINEIDLIKECNTLLLLIQGPELMLDTAQKAYHEVEHTNFLSAKLQTMEQLGFCLWENRKKEQATALLAKALKLCTTRLIVEDDQYVRILTNFVNYLVELDKLKEAQTFIKLADQHPCKTIVKILQYKSYIETKLGMKEQAVHTLDQAMSLAKTYSNLDEYVSAGLLQANFYLDNNKWDEAVTLANHLLITAEDLNDEQTVTKIKHILNLGSQQKNL